MDGAWPFAGRIFVFNVNGLGRYISYYVTWFFLLFLEGQESEDVQNNA